MQLFGICSCFFLLVIGHNAAINTEKADLLTFHTISTNYVVQ